MLIIFSCWSPWNKIIRLGLVSSTLTPSLAIFEKYFHLEVFQFLIDRSSLLLLGHFPSDFTPIWGHFPLLPGHFLSVTFFRFEATFFEVLNPPIGTKVSFAIWTSMFNVLTISDTTRYQTTSSPTTDQQKCTGKDPSQKSRIGSCFRHDICITRCTSCRCWMWTKSCHVHNHGSN